MQGNGFFGIYYIQNCTKSAKIYSFWHLFERECYKFLELFSFFIKQLYKKDISHFQTHFV